MIEVVLYQPEIPQNTGSVARTCAAVGAPLHLIRPLGFKLEDRYLKRAGLDYWPHVTLFVHDAWEDLLAARPGRRLVMSSAGNRGHDGRPYHLLDYGPDDLLVFGSESKGLPEALLDAAGVLARIPITGQVRSLNLSNAVSVMLYRALDRAGLL